MKRYLIWALALYTHSWSGITYSVELVESGPSQALLFPFFTTEKGWDTYIHISTLEPSRHAFKVRFLSADSGDIVASFNVYSERENWRVSLTKSDVGSIFRVAEGGCLLTESGEALSEGEEIDIPSSVGMVEVIALGGFPRESSDQCSTYAAYWAEGGKWDLEPPVSTLYNDDMLVGELYLVNVTEGLAATYTAWGLKGLWEEVVHSHPAGEFPNLTETEPVVRIDGTEIFPDSGKGIDAVAIALSQGTREIVNDVITSNAINARSDWVLSYPLSRHYDYKPFQVIINGEMRSCESFGGGYPEEGEQSVEIILDFITDVAVWGKGEVLGSPEFSPAPPVEVAASLCRSVNVVAFGDQPSVLLEESSNLLSPKPEFALNDLPSYSLRWAPFPFQYPEESGVYRPVLGFRITTFQNGTLNSGSTLGNYAVIRKHQRHKPKFQ